MGTIRSSSGNTSGRWTRQARPRSCSGPMAGRSGVPTAMYASLRSTGKYGGRATLPSSPGVRRGRGRRRACRRTARRGNRLSRLSSARPSASRYQRSWPSQVAASFRKAVADLVGRQVAQRQDQLAADARVGVVGHGRAGSSRCFSAARRLLGLGLLVFDVAVLAAVAAEHAHGLLADPRVALVDHLGQSGHRDRGLAVDRVPDPKRPSAVDRVARRGPDEVPTTTAGVRLLGLARSAPGGRRPGWRCPAT